MIAKIAPSASIVYQFLVFFNVIFIFNRVLRKRFPEIYNLFSGPNFAIFHMNSANGVNSQ